MQVPVRAPPRSLGSSAAAHVSARQAPRVLFVIDGLNQLDEANGARQLNWLPEELPLHVKVVTSCVADAYESPDDPVLEAFRRRRHRRLTIPDLVDEERLKIVRQVPALSAKILDGHQIGLLLDNPATANPLFLRVCLEELRGFGSYVRAQ